VAGERQGENFKHLIWTVADGGEGERLKTKEVKKMWGEKKEEVVV